MHLKLDIKHKNKKHFFAYKQEWRDDIQSTSNMRNNYSLYFTKPEQLLDIFNEMEEKSLPLIQKSQYTSEILDKIQSDINLTITEENQQVEQLQIKINQLEELIKHEIEREISCQNILMYFFF